MTLTTISFSRLKRVVQHAIWHADVSGDRKIFHRPPIHNIFRGRIIQYNRLHFYFFYFSFTLVRVTVQANKLHKAGWTDAAKEYETKIIKMGSLLIPVLPGVNHQKNAREPYLQDTQVHTSYTLYNKLCALKKGGVLSPSFCGNKKRKIITVTMK